MSQLVYYERLATDDVGQLSCPVIFCVAATCETNTRSFSLLEVPCDAQDHAVCALQKHRAMAKGCSCRIPVHNVDPVRLLKVMDKYVKVKGVDNAFFLGP